MMKRGKKELYSVELELELEIAVGIHNLVNTCIFFFIVRYYLQWHSSNKK